MPKARIANKQRKPAARTRKKRKRAELEISAGGVVYTYRHGKPKVVLVGRWEPHVTWRLPKGHIDKGESQIEAASREVSEETGVEVSANGPKLGSSNFYFTHPRSGKFIHKYVHFFLFKKIRGSVEKHDKEYDEARWFSFEQALKKASFKSDQAILRRARQIIKRRKSQTNKRRV